MTANVGLAILLVLGLLVLFTSRPQGCLLQLPTGISIVMIAISAFLSKWTGVKLGYINLGFCILFILLIILYNRFAYYRVKRKLKEHGGDPHPDEE